MRCLYFLSSAMLMCVYLTGGAHAQIVERRDFRRPPDSMPGEELYQRKISIGGNIDAEVVIEVTDKGNGGMELLNLRLKVVDNHDDGAVYVGGLLHVEFVDITGDGFKDLVITGTVMHTGEKETDPRSFETVTSIYLFDPKKKEFRLAFHCGPKLEY